MTEQVDRVCRLDLLREHQHCLSREPRAQLDRGTQTLEHEGRRHANVRHHKIRVKVRDHVLQLVRSSGLTHDIEALLLDQARDPLAHEYGVVREEQPQLPPVTRIRQRFHRIGRIAAISVPPLLGLSSTKLPPAASIRSRRPTSPDPASIEAPPSPSSETST